MTMLNTFTNCCLKKVNRSEWNCNWIRYFTWRCALNHLWGSEILNKIWIRRVPLFIVKKTLVIKKLLENVSRRSVNFLLTGLNLCCVISVWSYKRGSCKTVIPHWCRHLKCSGGMIIGCWVGIFQQWHWKTHVELQYCLNKLGDFVEK